MHKKISDRTKLADALQRIKQLEIELAIERSRHVKSRANITGQRFGRLTVTGEGKNRIYPSGRKDWLWECICDCGNVTFSSTGGLRSGNSGSCGCLQKYVQGTLKRTHGKSHTPTYRAWSGMISRCTYQSQPQYKDYGGRGIKVCERWRKSFTAFLADMGEKPKSTELDRINNDGNYEPDNCRWSTKKENCNNRRGTIFLTKRGERLPLQAWAKITGIPARTIRSRLRLGLSDRLALEPRS